MLRAEISNLWKQVKVTAGAAKEAAVPAVLSGTAKALGAVESGANAVKTKLTKEVPPCQNTPE